MADEASQCGVGRGTFASRRVELLHAASPTSGRGWCHEQNETCLPSLNPCLMGFTKALGKFDIFH